MSLLRINTSPTLSMWTLLVIGSLPVRAQHSSKLDFCGFHFLYSLLVHINLDIHIRRFFSLSLSLWSPCRASPQNNIFPSWVGHSWSRRTARPSNFMVCSFCKASSISTLSFSKASNVHEILLFRFDVLTFSWSAISVAIRSQHWSCSQKMARQLWHVSQHMLTVVLLGCIESSRRQDPRACFWDLSSVPIQAPRHRPTEAHLFEEPVRQSPSHSTGHHRPTTCSRLSAFSTRCWSQQPAPSAVVTQAGQLAEVPSGRFPVPQHHFRELQTWGLGHAVICIFRSLHPRSDLTRNRPRTSKRTLVGLRLALIRSSHAVLSSRICPCTDLIDLLITPFPWLSPSGLDSTIILLPPGRIWPWDRPDPRRSPSWSRPPSSQRHRKSRSHLVNPHSPVLESPSGSQHHSRHLTIRNGPKTPKCWRVQHNITSLTLFWGTFRPFYWLGCQMQGASVSSMPKVKQQTWHENSFPIIPSAVNVPLLASYQSIAERMSAKMFDKERIVWYSVTDVLYHERRRIVPTMEDNCVAPHVRLKRKRKTVDKRAKKQSPQTKRYLFSPPNHAWPVKQTGTITTQKYRSQDANKLFSGDKTVWRRTVHFGCLKMFRNCMCAGESLGVCTHPALKKRTDQVRWNIKSKTKISKHSNAICALVSCITWETARWLSTAPASSFRGLDFCQLGFFPISVSSGRATTSSGAHLACAVSSATTFESLRTTTSAPRDSIACATPNTATTLQPLHTSPVPRLSGAHLACSSVHRMARAAASPPPSLPAPPSPTPRDSTPIGAHPQASSAGHLPSPSHPVAPLHLTSPVPPLCSTGNCDSHCPSLLPLPLALLAHRTCRASGCSSPPHDNCLVGFCSTHCTSRRCQLRRSLPPVQRRCRRPDCLELETVHWGSATCTALALVVWCQILCHGQEAARRWTTPPWPPLLSFMHSVGLGQLNCRRLWGRDGSVHDGFMGLVSCLDQLGRRCMRARNSVSPDGHSSRGSMMALLAAMVARRGSYSTLPLLRPLSLGSLTCSLFAGVWYRALSLCLLILCGIASDTPGTRLQPQSIVSRSSTQTSRSFPFSGSVVHDRQMHLFCLLCRRYCSLILWCFGTLLSSLLTAVVPLWTWSNCCSRASLLSPAFFRPHVVLLSSRHSRLLSPNSAHPPCPVCLTGQLWSHLAITVSLRGTSPSWPTFLAHSLTFLRVLPLWTLSSTPSRKSSSTVHLLPGPATHMATSLVEWCMLPRPCRSGSPEDQAPFRLLCQQFHSTVRSPRNHCWNEWLGSVTSLSRRAPRVACSPHLPVPCCHSWPVPHAMAWRVPLCPSSWWGAPIFPLPLGTVFSDDFFH